jgi:phosphoglycerate dehydrogenase-like enzyme
VSPGPEKLTLAVAVPLEPELVAQIQALDGPIEVIHDPGLLPPPRYPGDHAGAEDFRRDTESEERFAAMLKRAEVLYGIPGDRPEGLRAAVRSNAGLRWVQATAAGAGEQVRAACLTEEELRRVTVTSAAGVHAGPLAEFAMLGLLAFARGLPRLLADKHEHRWRHYPVAELRGATVLVLGLGQIGHEVARLTGAFGMEVLAINRRGESDSPHISELGTLDALTAILPRADAVVVTLPLTEQTKGLLDEEKLERMKDGAILVNVGRGGVVDEEALVDALRAGKLRGAALDVFATEPLPAESSLWELPNVIISPHTAALSPRENERIVRLFTDNVKRYLAGEPLRNRVDPTHFY